MGRLFNRKKYIVKMFNSIAPRFFHYVHIYHMIWEKRHWKTQKFGDIHGYDKYCKENRSDVSCILREIKSYSDSKDDKILDLGCNCGYTLSKLYENGYSNLTGIDICSDAINWGTENLDLKAVSMINDSFDVGLNNLIKTGSYFDIIYTIGATIELISPAYDLIGALCKLSKKYVVLIISEYDHSYPRYYEYEFAKHGFYEIKAQRPYNWDKNQSIDPQYARSLLVFQKIS